MLNLYVFATGALQCFVAEQNWKKARNFLWKARFFGDVKITAIRGKRIKQKIEALPGLIDADTIYDKYAWWQCRCGGTSFLRIDDGKICRCKSCGCEKRTPNV